MEFGSEQARVIVERDALHGKLINHYLLIIDQYLRPAIERGDWITAISNIRWLLGVLENANRKIKK